ncbi:MobC family plasmid mobilization relaxosome protein [Allorhizobium sp. BGMRC 0089]|uniref:plasmid mobilization protein n=1 Tax=Allorhizobium sonneratiae TaxID=2934936 RepID=UPI0020334B34|nr:plasmid mobilization relaxosome protein MobC [Allorhizobium sonneratiae]MCM2294715.1 MobC family plasmid mobilization relaxosome protein [Allorhizobium sonneratiae]
MREVLDQTVKIRMSKRQKDKVEAAAREAGVNPSSFYRSVVLEGAGISPFFTEQDIRILAKILSDMRKIGVNINQIARALNSNRQVHSDEILTQLKNVLAVHERVDSELVYLRSVAPRRRRGEVDDSRD